MPEQTSATSPWRYAAAAACAAVVVVLVLVVLFQAEHLFLSVFAGALVACLLDALSGVLRRRTPLSNGVALGVVVVVFLLAAVGLTWALAPTVVSQTENLVDQIPQAVEDLRARVQELPGGARFVSMLGNATEGDAATLSNAAGRATDVMGTMARVFAYTLVILAVGIYLAASPRTYIHGLLRLVPTSKRPAAADLLREVGSTLRWWLVGRAASLAVVGVLTAIGLVILGVPGALALGIAAGVLSVIPNFGPVLSLVPAALITIPQGGRMVGYVVLLYLGVQFLESYLITPMIQQRAVHLPPALILTTQVLMGVLFGFLGLLLATPLLAALLVVVKRVYLEGYLGEADGSDGLGRRAA